MRQTLAHTGDNKVMCVSDQVGMVQVLKESDLLLKEWLLIMTLPINQGSNMHERTSLKPWTL